MYLDYFGVADAPFSIAPDPRYLFMSLKHREALAHLLYGVKSDNGFVVLTGEVGTGKTTVCRCLLEQLPANCDVAVIFNPKLSVLELLATLCEEFRITVSEARPGIKAYIDHINAWLLASHAKGRMAVLIVDEAQSLEPEVLEQLRLLTNLETNKRKLLRILLLGQPQLRDILARPDMVQLAQRIVARYHLGPLSRPEMKAYVIHRLSVAGAKREVFSPLALDRLYRLSGGIPRLVNVIADRALLGAYVGGRERVDRATVGRAGQEVLGEGQAGRRHKVVGAALFGLVALGGTAVAVAAYVRHDVPDSPVAAESTKAAPLPAVPAVLPSGAPLPASLPLLSSPETFSAPGAGTIADSEPAPADAPPSLLGQGDRGKAVEQLRRDLALIQGKVPENAGNPVFDEELARQVRLFQVARGLLPDGIVGPQTRRHLASARLKAEGR